MHGKTIQRALAEIRALADALGLHVPGAAVADLDEHYAGRTARLIEGAQALAVEAGAIVRAAVLLAAEATYRKAEAEARKEAPSAFLAAVAEMAEAAKEAREKAHEAYEHAGNARSAAMDVPTCASIYYTVDLGEAGTHEGYAEDDDTDPEGYAGTAENEADTAQDLAEEAADAAQRVEEWLAGFLADLAPAAPEQEPEPDYSIIPLDVLAIVGPVPALDDDPDVRWSRSRVAYIRAASVRSGECTSLDWRDPDPAADPGGYHRSCWFTRNLAGEKVEGIREHPADVQAEAARRGWSVGDGKGALR